MKYTDEAYIKLIANAIGKKEYDIDFSLISTERLIKLCGFHRTIGLVWLGMSKLEDLPERYKKMFVSGLKREVIEYVNKSSLLESLSKELSDKKIKHILIKGKTVARYYPQEELRRLGDIDLLISKNDKEKVKKIIENMGASYVYDNSDENVDFYTSDKVDIEVHSKIVTGKWFSENKIYEAFTQRAYETSQKLNDCLYELDFVTSLTYNVYHAAKHFYEGGCGIRMIVDLWLMKEIADESLLQEAYCMMEAMGLKNFARKVFKLGDIWFGDSKEKLDNMSEIQHYIITSGLYGRGNVDDDISQIRKAKNDSYVVNVFNWLFPSYKQMRETNLWFKDKPAILLPVAYIVRGYNNVKERGGILKTSKKVLDGKKQNSNLNNMLKIMELDNE